MCVIGYSKAFDCVNHNQLWTDMQRMGFLQHIIKLVQLYQYQMATVIADLFPTSHSVKQECTVSPTLFNIYTEDIINLEVGITIEGRLINNIRHADYTTLLCKSSCHSSRELRR